MYTKRANRGIYMEKVYIKVYIYKKSRFKGIYIEKYIQKKQI